MIKPISESIAIHKAMGDPTRLRALCLLVPGELCVCELVQVLGLAPSTVSTHLTELHRAGLLEREKRGRWQFYRLAARSESKLVRNALRMLPLIEDDERLAADARELKRIKRMKPGELTSCY